jgi:predicted transcriptional regulator
VDVGDYKSRSMKSVSNCAISTKPKISQYNLEIAEVPPDNNNLNRNTILIAIIQNPGIRYRELLRLTDLSNGVLAHHLKRIEKSRRIIVVRQNKKTTRYFSIGIPIGDVLIIGHIRHSTTRRRILTFILEQRICTFNSIVEHISKAPSTISWHLKALIGEKIVSNQKNESDKRSLYRLTFGGYVAYALSNYNVMAP